jgi:hypothetical protein
MLKMKKSQAIECMKDLLKNGTVIITTPTNLSYKTYQTEKPFEDVKKIISYLNKKNVKVGYKKSWGDFYTLVLIKK